MNQTYFFVVKFIIFTKRKSTSKSALNFVAIFEKPKKSGRVIPHTHTHHFAPKILCHNILSIVSHIPTVKQCSDVNISTLPSLPPPIPKNPKTHTAQNKSSMGGGSEGGYDGAGTQASRSEAPKGAR
jgi:hypothetical protein